MSHSVLLLALAGLTTSALILVLSRRQGLLHPACVYAMLCSAHFFLPGLLIAIGLAPSFVAASNEPYLLDALAFTTCCLMCAAIGAASAQRLLLRQTSVRADIRTDLWSSRRVVFVSAVLFVASWATKLYVIQADAYFQIQRTVQGELEGPFYALVRMVEQFSLYAVVILATYNWRSKESATRRLTSAIVLASTLELIYWLPAGRKEESILCIVLPLAARYLSTRMLPSKKAIAGIVLFVVTLFPLMFYYRAAMELNLTELSASEAASLLDIAGDSVDAAEVSAAPAEVAFERISLLEPVSASVRLIESNSWKVLHGGSYADLLVSVVPRALWPGKPALSYGNEFGSAAGFLPDDDDETSISVTYIGEAFLNFGWFGFLPMVVIGFFYGALFRYAGAARDVIMARAIYIIALPRLLYIGNTFAIDFGGHLKLLPFFVIVCIAMRSGPGLRFGPGLADRGATA